MCVCVCVCVCICLCVRVCACVSVCVRARVTNKRKLYEQYNQELIVVKVLFNIYVLPPSSVKDTNLVIGCSFLYIKYNTC